MFQEAETFLFGGCCGVLVFFVLLVLLCCFGFVLCSFVSFLAPSHKSCGVFQVSVEGHWTYSWTYVLVLQIFLRLFNLDCRYPRDLLQPASKKKHSVVSFDYGYASRLEDEHKITILCAYDRDTDLIHAVPSLSKGGKHFHYLTTALARFIVLEKLL